MRPLIALVLACVAVAAPAQSAPVEEERYEWVPFHLGADLGVLMRQEAGGQRTPLPALTLRGRFGELGPVSFATVYQFAFALEGTVVRGFSQHHRLHLRPEVRWPLGAAFFSLNAGPGVQVIHSVVWDSQRRLESLYPRWCVGGELSFGVTLGGASLRTGVDVTYAPGRLDLLIGLGATFAFGGGEA